MKIGIVGSGFVGATAGYALVMQGVGREIVPLSTEENVRLSESAMIIRRALAELEI
ncbi:MAG: hypothetical protein ND866_11770 [Pyrinomonadaceae bacterium]|nr:hypothetical protein [Pyrinomonadaceae bacterium]